MVLCGPAAAHSDNLKDICLTCVQLGSYISVSVSSSTIH